MNFTKHAKVRMQQRSIPVMIINWLVDYGETVHSSSGATKHSFSKKSIRKIKRFAGHSIDAYVNDYRNAYVVTIDNAVITAAWKTKRIKS